MPSLSKVGSEMLDGALPALDASSLTSIPAGNITGTLPAISGTNLTNLDARDLENALPAISGASLTSLPGITCKNVYTTYNLANAPSTVNYTGAGFQPSAVICFYNAGSDIVSGWSMSDYTTTGDTGIVHVFHGSNPGKVANTTAPFIRIDTATLSSTGNPTIRVYGAWSSHSDGITISYTSHLSTPSGTLYLKFLFIK